MKTMIELTEYVRGKALEYLTETEEALDVFPLSIVDFVIEQIAEYCHFPNYYTEADIVYILSKNKNSLSMACVDVYSKAGAEGQIAHSENGISRTYDSSWISPKILRSFPSYATII